MKDYFYFSQDYLLWLLTYLMGGIIIGWVIPELYIVLMLLCGVVALWIVIILLERRKKETNGTKNTER